MQKIFAMGRYGPIWFKTKVSLSMAVFWTKLAKIGPWSNTTFKIIDLYMFASSVVSTPLKTLLQQPLQHVSFLYFDVVFYAFQSDYLWCVWGTL